jgi:sigma-B regulation protein RsbU (phosphoserine phosphatase)
LNQALQDPVLLSQLLGLLVHDLRNPLAGLKCNATLLEDGATPSGILEGVVEDIEVSCTMLGHLLDNAELLARELGGAPPVQLTDVSVGDVVARVVQELSAVAKSHGTTIVVASDIPHSLHVLSQRELLTRTLLNYLYNAIQHGAVGPVRVSLRTTDSTVTISVLDRGEPISPELREVVFTAPGQVKSRGQDHGRYSRGLGLFIARSAGQRAGGSVRACVEGGENALEIELKRGSS